jgi:hypothetical protein
VEDLEKGRAVSKHQELLYGSEGVGKFNPTVGVMIGVGGGGSSALKVIAASLEAAPGTICWSNPILVSPCGMY